MLYTPFEMFDDFWGWYISIIKSYAPDCDIMPQSEVLDRVPRLSTSEEAVFIGKLKEIQPLPQGIELIVNDRNHTLFSCYNQSNGKVVIAVPSIVRYWVRFPALIKIGLQHEMGHVIGGDIYQPISPAHRDCINQCMDIRINQNVNLLGFQQLMCCLFFFKNEMKEILAPEFWFPKLGLPISLKNKLSWRDIHMAFHEMYGDIGTGGGSLNVGDYIISLKQINEFTAGKFGIVTAFDKSADTFTVSVFRDEVQSAWRSENYILLKQLFKDLAGLEQYDNGQLVVESKKVPDLCSGILGEALINKVDIIKAIPPKENDAKPKIGDFVVTIDEIKNDTGDIVKIGQYGQIVKEIGYTEDENPKPIFEVKPLIDEASLAFRKNDAATFRELLINSENGIIRGPAFAATFPNQIVITECPNDKKEEETGEPVVSGDPPKIGDVVKVKATGSWGVVQKINEDFTFEIQDVTEEVAKRILKAK